MNIQGDKLFLLKYSTHYSSLEQAENEPQTVAAHKNAGRLQITEKTHRIFLKLKYINSYSFSP